MTSEPTLRQLRVFAAVARHRSFTHAARELRLTQPAVSMQVRTLEGITGLPLLERLGREVVLTEAGRALLPHAQAALRSLEDAGAALAALRGLDTGRIDIAVVSTAKYFAPKLLAQFSKLHPGVELRLAVNNREAVIQLLAENGVDLAIMGTAPRHLETSAFPFAKHPLVIVAAPDHPLASQRHVPARALSGETFIVREPGSGTRAAMERYLRAHRVEPVARTEIASNETIKQAVMAGMGLAFISQHAIGLELATRQLTLLDVEGLPVVRDWNVVHRTGRRLSPGAVEFKRFVLKQGRAFLSTWPAAVPR